jgi:hypothetical protein
MMLCCLWAAFAVPLFAQGQSQSNGYAPQPVIKPECKLALFRGLNEAYNEQYLEAEDHFDEYSRCDPTDPIGEWRKAYSWCFRLRADQKADMPRVDAKTYAGFMALAERGVKKAEAKIVRGEAADFYRYVIAEIRSVEAIMTVHNDGAFSWKKSQSMLLEAIERAKRSRYQDAQYLVGFTNYRTSLRNRALQWLSGFPHDRCDGLMLVQAAEKGNLGIFSDDVRLVIASIAASPKKVAEEDRRQCPGYRPRVLFDELLVRYPRNILLRRLVLGPAGR